MKQGHAFTLLELMIVIAILMILGMITVPRVQEALVSARESAAQQEVHNLYTAQAQYLSQYGRYAVSLTELGPGAGAAGLIAEDLAAGNKSGYHYEIQATVQGYRLSATPLNYPVSGRVTFTCDQTGVLRQARPVSGAAKN